MYFNELETLILVNLNQGQSLTTCDTYPSLQSTPEAHFGHTCTGLQSTGQTGPGFGQISGSSHAGRRQGISQLQHLGHLISRF